MKNECREYAEMIRNDVNRNDTRVVITIDDEEQISLRDFGYISDEDFGDKEAIVNAIHNIIADLWKMRDHLKG